MDNALDFSEKQVVLVVDDTPDNLRLMSGRLKDQHRVKVAINGAKGLQIAASDAPPDLALLDIMMPDMDGHEACRRLEAAPKTRDFPVILLTARAEDERCGF